MYKLNENSGNNPYFCNMNESQEIVQDLKRALLGKLKEALVSVFPVILLVFVGTVDFPGIGPFPDFWHRPV